MSREVNEFPISMGGGGEKSLKRIIEKSTALKLIRAPIWAPGKRKEQYRVVTRSLFTPSNADRAKNDLLLYLKLWYLSMIQSYDYQNVFVHLCVFRFKIHVFKQITKIVEILLFFRQERLLTTWWRGIGTMLSSTPWKMLSKKFWISVCGDLMQPETNLSILRSVLNYYRYYKRWQKQI